MSTKAVALVRVSKAKQAADDRFSLPAQRRAIERYALEHGLEVVAEFEEPGTSAYVTEIQKIPGLAEAVRRIEAGDAGRLLFHESSRLARTVLLASHVAERLKRVGAGLVNVSMGIDYNATAETRMMFGTESALNEYWSGKMSEHLRKAKREQFEQGLPIGKIPFGYTHALVDGPAGSQVTTRKLPPVIVPHEAEAIRKAYEDFSNGATAHEISRRWNLAGYAVRSTKGLTYWQPQTVRDILRNRLYAGYVRHGDDYLKGLHEPIVSEELYWSAQRNVQRVSWRKHPPKLLRGVATCVEGHRLRVLPAKNSRKRSDYIHYYYREPSTDIERPCEQGGLLWSTKEPDAQVEALFRAICTDDDWLAYVSLQAGRSSHRDVKAERERIEGELERSQKDYHKKRLSEERWDQIYAECQAALARLGNDEEPLSAAHAKLTSWLDLWDSASPYAKNETCRLVFQQAVIDFKKRELTLVPWPEFEPLFDCRLRYLGQDSPGPTKWLLCCSAAS